MLKKLIGIAALSLMLSPVVALAGNVVWDDGDTEDHNWSSGDNWHTNSEPTNADTAYLKGAGAGITDVYSDTATCNILWNAYDGTHVLTIKDGALLDVVGSAYGTWQNDSDTVSTLTVEAGGQLDVGDDLTVMWPAGGAIYYQSCTLNNYGEIDVADGFLLSRNVGGPHYGLANLYDGNLYCNTISMRDGTTETIPGSQNDYMNITNGALYVKGDVQTQIQGYVDSGWIEGFGGAGWIEMELVTLSSPKAGSGQYTKVWAEVPEPGTMLLAGFGALVLLLSRRKR